MTHDSLVIATSNQGKFVEIKDVLRDFNVRLLSLKDFPGISEAPEEGDTFAEIADHKASFYFHHIQLPVVAEDSGLVIPGLGGFPGIRSARIGASDADRIQVVLDKLKDRKDRFAFYHCSMVFRSHEVNLAAEGRCDGAILDAPRGTRGFGYDPIFQPEGTSKSFAEMSLQEKAAYSHRGRALQKLMPLLRNRIQDFS
jgi:XTP/dITP diphosphohydrolase